MTSMSPRAPLEMGDDIGKMLVAARLQIINQWETR